MSKNPNYKKAAFYFILVIFVLLISFYSLINNLLLPADPSDKTGHVQITIPSNTTSASIAKSLSENKLIKSSFAFVLYTRLKGLDSRLKAGDYLFRFNQSTPEIINQIVAGKETYHKVTIPEGYNIKQIAELLSNEKIINKEAFYSETNSGTFDYDFLTDYPDVQNKLEGYLFPDTYYFSKGVSAHGVIELMLHRFAEKIKTLNYIQKAQKEGFTLHQALTIASMVEKEARSAEERPIIAGVIKNRLRRNMPLQVDATIQFALGRQEPKLYYKDLEIDSPYNTYRNNGFPPGPIASPGEASLLAVVSPIKTDYLYYVAKSDGTHAFAKTLQEHIANVNKYQH
ncbi:MAG: Aminodeoxychorismate lyase [Desulfotomaculum sp. 46_296]|nr:MAG: Aminodeoxychorismate lyase [Desulfotomaculum sp. 46_296]HAU31093.1 endolytic transglycosylase MltG [Desulfotomaculum sp.]